MKWPTALQVLSGCDSAWKQVHRWRIPHLFYAFGSSSLSFLSLDRGIPFSFSLPLSVQLYSPEATISNVFTHNVCLPNIVDEGKGGWLDGRDHSVRTGGSRFEEWVIANGVVSRPTKNSYLLHSSSALHLCNKFINITLLLTFLSLAVHLNSFPS